MVLVTAVKFAASAAGKAVKLAHGNAPPPKYSKPQTPGGLTKVYSVSPALKKFVGSGEISRTETMKKVWAYIKDKNLQDPMAKREVLCDDTLKQLFPDKERVTFAEIPRLLSAHFPPNFPPQ